MQTSPTNFNMGKMINFLSDFKKYYTKKNVNIFFSGLLCLSILSLGVRYFVSPDLLNRLEAIPNSYLSTNNTNAYSAAGTLITALSSNGFTVGSSALTNTNADNYVAWNWKAATTSGFTVVTYTGTGANRTISHTLGATPAFIMIKRTDTAGSNWAVYHTSLGNTKYMLLNSTAAAGTSATYWNNTSPTTANFTVGTSADVNTNGGSYVAYIYAEVPGFSKFGSYTGNGSVNGPFVYTGFKSRYMLIKRTDSTGDWYIWDTVRNTYNPAAAELLANSSAVEAGTTDLDVLSNGFKIRATTAGFNVSGRTYIYAAFADQPFKEQSSPYNLTIASSTRFVGENSAFLKRIPGVSGNTQTFTISAWVKRNRLSTNYESIFGSGSGAADSTNFYFGPDDKLYMVTNNTNRLVTNAVYRDPSSWHHYVWAVDTTQAVASDRMKLYVDGVQVTSFSSTSYPAQNTTSSINSTVGQVVGASQTGSNGLFMYGYMSDVYMVDGQQLSASSFGETDTNGIWRPKTYSGAYGTNGFHLPLTTTTPGTDTSGNGNTFTNNNIATTDNVIDSPTNNFATFSPIDSNQPSFLTNGNLDTSGGSNGNYYPSTIKIPDSGKWYFESVSTNFNASQIIGWFGVASGSALNHFSGILSRLGAAGAKGFYQDSVSQENVARGSLGAVFGMYIDRTTLPGTITVYIDGVSQGTVNIASGDIFAFHGTYISGASQSNFGQLRALNGSPTTFDVTAGGYFKHTPTSLGLSDVKALSTANMPASTITKPNTYFDAVTYTGNGTTQAISTLNFSPDLLWIKDRTTAQNHVIFGDGSTIISTVTSFFQWFEF